MDELPFYLSDRERSILARHVAALREAEARVNEIKSVISDLVRIRAGRDDVVFEFATGEVRESPKAATPEEEA